MGTTSSSTALSNEQADLKWLGERFPYGDAELRHLYRAYQRLLVAYTAVDNDTTSNGNTAPTTSRSFLQDWAVECMMGIDVYAAERYGSSPNRKQQKQPRQDTTTASSSPNTNSTKAQDERRALIQMVEEFILDGTHVGNSLFQVACEAPGDLPLYSTIPTDHGSGDSPSSTANPAGQSSSSSPPQQQQPASWSGPVDEYTRKARLEHLFEGMANMARRGSKHALQVLFDAVHLQQQQQQRQPSSTTTTATSTSPQSVDRSIPAAPLVEMGYRLALATGFLQAVQALEKKKNIQNMNHNTSVIYEDVVNDGKDEEDEIDLLTIASKDLLKQFAPSSDFRTGLIPMAHSLTEKTKIRLNRHGILTQNQAGWKDDDPATIEMTDVVEWSEVVAPLFAAILPTFLFHVLFWGRPHPPTRTPFEFPNHRPSVSGDEDEEEEERLPSILDNRPRLFALACTSSALMGPYFRLYTSASDGLSFNRILNALLGYSGPTLLLIRSVSGGEFGAFTSHTWKETKDFYGNSDCFLFQLYDSLAVYRPTGRDQNYMYCNSHARSKGYDQQAHGIGFGGTVQQPRLFIAENLMEECQAASQDLTFENGSLLPRNHVSSSFSSHSNSSHPTGGIRSSSSIGNGPSSSSAKQFEIESMEIWGVGGSEIVQQALNERRKARELREETIRRSRKVDKAQFLDDFRSGAIASKAFAYREQIDGRADEDVKDRHSKKYVYE